MHNSKEERILVIIASTLLIFIIFSASFFFVLINRGFYDASFDKHGVYNDLGVDGVRSNADNLINYLTSENSETSSIDNGLYTEKEISHLKDVKRLIIILKYLSIISLVLLAIIIYRMSTKDYLLQGLKKISLYCSLAVFGIIIILFLGSLKWDLFFQAFHSVLFPQGNYAFQSDSFLIRLFPEEFFQDYARRMMFHALIIGLIALFLGTTSALTAENAKGHKVKDAKRLRKI